MNYLQLGISYVCYAPRTVDAYMANFPTNPNYDYHRMDSYVDWIPPK